MTNTKDTHEELKPEDKFLNWQDGIDLKFDDNLLFGKGYDFDGLECLGQECLTSIGRAAIWPDRISGGKWSVYWECDGGYKNDFESEQNVKEYVVAQHKYALTAPANITIEDVRGLMKNYGIVDAVTMSEDRAREASIHNAALEAVIKLMEEKV